MKKLRVFLDLAAALFFLAVTSSCSSSDDDIPTVVVPKTWSSVAPGRFHTMAVRSDGTLWTWGLRSNARLGINPIRYDSIPTRVGVASDWIAVCSGENHTVALKSNGTLWGIGANNWAQLGSGSDELYRVTPTQIGTDRDWQYFATGNDNGVTVKNNGQIYTWGSYNYPEWNQGFFIDDHPVMVANLIGIVKLAAGGVHNLAIKTDGSLWAWGRNAWGELGDGMPTESMRATPLRLGTENNWTSVAAGRYHSFALKTNGTLWAWGNNAFGQLGIGPGNSYVPMQIGTDNNWKSVAAGITYGVALKTDGSLWSWGSNYFGQLGDGTQTDKNNPVQVGDAHNWASLFGGYTNTFAKKADGTLWAWGNNDNGQLGIGSTANTSVPVLVNCPQL